MHVCLHVAVLEIAFSNPGSTLKVVVCSVESKTQWPRCVQHVVAHCCAFAVYLQSIVLEYQYAVSYAVFVFIVYNRISATGICIGC